MGQSTRFLPPVQSYQLNQFMELTLPHPRKLPFSSRVSCKKLEHNPSPDKWQEIEKVDKVLRFPPCAALHVSVENKLIFNVGFFFSLYLMQLGRCNQQIPFWSPKFSVTLYLERWGNWPDTWKLYTRHCLIASPAVDKALFIQLTHTLVQSNWDVYPVWAVDRKQYCLFVCLFFFSNTVLKGIGIHGQDGHLTFLSFSPFLFLI